MIKFLKVAEKLFLYLEYYECEKTLRILKNEIEGLKLKKLFRFKNL